MEVVQHRHIAAAIEARIVAWGLRPGDRLPPEGDLAARLGVTRHQARKGLALLKARGRLVQRRGAGTFIPLPKTASAERAFVVVEPFSPMVVEELAPLQQGAFEHEYHVRLVNTGPVHQDPAYERECLERLLATPVAGVVIEPTPFPPGSFDLYESLRLAGTKVAVLNCPPERVGDHAVFELDFHKAGYLACVELAMAGWRRQCLVSALTLASQWDHAAFRAGVLEAARDFGVEMNVTYAHVRYNSVLGRCEWPPDASPPALAEGIGYICSWAPDASLLRAQLLAAGCRDFGMIAGTRRRESTPFPCILIDFVERYRRILGYFLDDSVSATEHIRNVTQPKRLNPTQDTA